MKRLNIVMLGLMVLGLTATSFKSVEGGQEEGLVKWYTFEEAVALNKKKPKKIFIDVYTDWCGWCKKMDKATFNHPKIAKYLNENYYPVKLNAEQKEDIEFDGHTFKWVEGGRRGIHELAYSLLQGKMSYPTVVFMDEQFRMLSPVPGYLEPPVFEKIITYYGDDNYKETPWTEYQENFKSSL
jgi:thioredoxin-related protein